MMTAVSLSPPLPNMPRTLFIAPIIVTMKPYFFLTNARTASKSVPVARTAFPEMIDEPEVTLPRWSLGWNVTRLSLRIRLHFHDSPWVVKPTVPSPRSTIHTGDDLPSPFLRYVVSETYFSSVIDIAAA